MAKSELSIGDLIKKGWRDTKSHATFLLQIAVIYVLISFITGYFQAWTENQVVGAILVSIISTIISTVLQIGIIKIGLDITDGKKPNWRDLYENYNKFIPFFLTSILLGLIILVGFILLIIPGIYLAVKYQFTPYLLVDKKIAYLSAIKEAGRLTQGRWFQVFLFDLAMVGLFILGALALGVGLLIAIPVAFLASIHLYRKLSA